MEIYDSYQVKGTLLHLTPLQSVWLLHAFQHSISKVSKSEAGKNLILTRVWFVSFSTYQNPKVIKLCYKLHLHLAFTYRLRKGKKKCDYEVFAFQPLCYPVILHFLI